MRFNSTSLTPPGRHSGQNPDLSAPIHQVTVIKRLAQVFVQLHQRVGHRRVKVALLLLALLASPVLLRLAPGGLRLVVSAAGGSALTDEMTKEQKHARMRELEAQIATLRQQLARDPANTSLLAQLNAAQTELKALSTSLGGDMPANEARINTAAMQRESSQLSRAQNVVVETLQPATTGCNVTTTTTTNSTPVAILDVATTTSTINVAGTGSYLYDLDIQTFLRHTFAADTDITITSPAGTVVTLTTDNGAGNDDAFNGTLWDDQANPGGQVPYTSNNGLVTDHAYTNLTLASPLVPEEPLAAFNGENPNGVWTITIRDDLSGDIGTLDSWSLHLSTLPVAPTATTTTLNNNTPVAIPTGPVVVTSSINVAGLSNQIGNVRLTTFIPHTFAADLDITLTSPSGRVVTLTTDNGAGNDNVFNGTLWDNKANPGGQVPYTSNNGLVTDHGYANLTLASPLTPEESLAAFQGENPNGTWTITISDDLAGDGGSLDNWSLELTTFKCAVPPPFTASLTDPFVCNGIGSSILMTAQLTNPNATAQAGTFNVTLPAQLTLIPNTCTSTIGTCTPTPNTQVTWSGNIPAGQTVTITYQAQIADGTPDGTLITINSTGSVAGVEATASASGTVSCPGLTHEPENVKLSDQKAGSLVVFPFYTSKSGSGSDTKLHLSNTGETSAFVHLFFIDGATCNQADYSVCLTPNGSLNFLASEMDPDTTGWLMAVVVDAQGNPIQNNGLIGNAFVNDGNYVGNYGAESFWAYSNNLATINEDKATLRFNGTSYDAMPNQFAVEIQSPRDIVGQKIVTVGMNGDITRNTLSGAAQLGVGVVYNGNEKPFGSFSGFLTGICQASATITGVSPRVPFTMAGIIPSGQVGTIKLNIGGGVGLLLTPQNSKKWSGIRGLHKTGTTFTTITIPVFVPVC